MLQTTLHSDDLRRLLDEADDETLDELLEMGASWEEIAETAHMAQHDGPSAHLPSSTLVARVHELLFARRQRDRRRFVRQLLRVD